MTTQLECLDEHRCFGGRQLRYRHRSESVDGDMTFSIFLPPGNEDTAMPVLWWLSGLTCTDQNFVQKAGAQRKAAELGLIIVCPDTSPRDAGVPGEDDRYDLGSGAGFYVDATQDPWSEHYRMYDYVTRELPSVIREHFNVTEAQSISGHSMGGHGALVCALKNPGKYASVSAFSPIVNPTECQWGVDAFQTYLGEDRASWSEYDACELVRKNTARQPLLVEQGEADNFLDEQLKPDRLEAVCQELDHPLTLNMRAGYDHSYFFIASFIDEHLDYHARHLSGA
ncbi:S-formylglutathione hydrolase [Larsenimonas salina]|uniref:S-formylglutathione hydrolase n=1 Tax=Larsenimonas salina TaxID=1295565 RepID=UPI0020734926|nr:S-formylglutathione hydrolase [Larsenimonas salina]MCM5703893.1 S-formylglutathione hydrolase [Larsenimonas salina]